jgi:hypothetical protein
MFLDPPASCYQCQVACVIPPSVKVACDLLKVWLWIDGLMGLWILDDPMEIILASCQFCSPINKMIWSWSLDPSDKWVLRICLSLMFGGWCSLMVIINICNYYQRSQSELFPTTSVDTSLVLHFIRIIFQSKVSQSCSAQLGWSSWDSTVRYLYLR